MLPRHINNVPEDKKAVAPYNFVELPNDIVEVKPESLPQENSYDFPSQKRYTGRIECKLTTKSPLYIRCGLTKEEFECDTESKDLPDFFYTQLAPKTRKPILPGSSLRGMLRGIVEIISFSKIDRVSHHQHFFFRAVGVNKKDDPLGNEYKSLLNKVKAGYLEKKESSWYIQPAKIVDKSPFIWVREQNLSQVKTLIRMNQRDYRPQYINVSFGDTFLENYKRFTSQISGNKSSYRNKGTLVTSGNMLESSDNSRNLYRKNHCIVPEANSDAKPLKINDDAVQHYRSALTDFQKQEPPFDKEFGVLQSGMPVFYCEPQNGQTEVTLFGHSPYFRIPYSFNRDGKAASAVDFIPKTIGKSNKIDLAEAIFGFVRTKDKDVQENTDEQALKSLAGRVFIENAICETNNSDDIWLTDNANGTITPKILSTPKPTTFQHYLVQTKSHKSNLKHYASKPSQDNEGDTVIRGHKLYWHKKSVGRKDIEEQDIAKISKSSSQYTQIKPIKSGVLFNFCIHFENLNQIELGALLWVLKIAADPQYSLSLGMGKPLGMGAIKIEHQLYLSNRVSRYSQLFNNKKNEWLTGEEDQTNTASHYSTCIQVFEKYIIEKIHEDDQPQKIKATKLEHIPRIQMLLAMLGSNVPPKNEETRYMTIEPENEYKERPVLPTPLQIKKITDNRKFPNPSTLPQNTSTNQFERPKLRKDDKAKNPQQNKHKPNLGDGNNSNRAIVRPKPPNK